MARFLSFKLFAANSQTLGPLRAMSGVYLAVVEAAVDDDGIAGVLHGAGGGGSSCLIGVDGNDLNPSRLD